MSIYSSLNIIIPEITAFLAGIFLILTGVIIKNKKFMGFLTALFFSLILFSLVFASQEGEAFNNSFISTKFTIMIKSFIVMIACIIYYITKNYLKHNNLFLFEYNILFIFSILGMMIMISSNDLMLLYLGIELQSLSLYVMVALKRDSVRSSEAALKYFILGSIASAIILYGSSMIYSVTGSTNYFLISETLVSKNSLTIFSFGLILILSGIAFKLSAAPFHMWTPDVYEGAPSSVTTILITLPKVAALCVIIKLLFGPFINLIDIWKQILIIVSISSMVIGSISALKQENLKRLFAYSTIGNIGYVLMGIITATESGIAAAFLYLIIYTIGSLGIFSFIMFLRRDNIQLVNLSSISGLSKSNPGIALCVVILIFSLAGIPPFAGFFAKFYIFTAAIEQDLVYLAILGVIFSVVSVFYYLKLIKIMYIDELVESINMNIDKKLSISIILSAVAMIFFIFYANDFINYVNSFRIIQIESL